MPAPDLWVLRGFYRIGEPLVMPCQSKACRDRWQRSRNSAVRCPIPASPDKAVLDRVRNPHPDTNYVARFTFPEFTVMCPVTGQPDFATLVIDYVPKDWLVESKSLKLYLNSFRNHGAFHEDCTVAIGKKLVALLKPKWLRIGGYFHPRGGMPIDVFWQAGKLPSGVWVPDQGVRTYSARG